MAQEKVRKPIPKVPREEAERIAESDAARQDAGRDRREAKEKERQEHLDGLDDLLDEIDTILEEQDVLTSYRQRGGQ